MRFWSRRSTALSVRPLCALVAALFVVPQLVADEAAVDAGSLIADLGSSDYAVRQRATMQLKAGGQELLPQIVVALQSNDAEVRSRAWNVLLARALSSRTEVRNSARDAIRRLSEN